VHCHLWGGAGPKRCLFGPFERTLDAPGGPLFIWTPGHPKGWTMAVRDHRKQKRRTRGPAKFKKTDLVRAVKAAQASELPVARVEIDPHTGKISVVVGQPAEKNDTPESIIDQL
jgi:hypothetical protein